MITEHGGNTKKMRYDRTYRSRLWKVGAHGDRRMPENLRYNYIMSSHVCQLWKFEAYQRLWLAGSHRRLWEVGYNQMRLDDAGGGCDRSDVSRAFIRRYFPMCNIVVHTLQDALCAPLTPTSTLNSTYLTCYAPKEARVSKKSSLCNSPRSIIGR